MSLRVWLPLTKDLRNQGLDDVTITNNGATFNSAGKLGGCYQFGPSKNIKLMEYASTFSSFNEFSLSVWFKCTAQNTGHTGSALISCGNWNQVTHLLNLALGYYDTDHYTKLLITNSSGWGYGYSYNFQLDTWYHVVLTSGQEEVKAYVNGELIGSSTNAIVPTDMEQSWICIGNATYYSSFTFNGFMNDVRIYDHCLSEMEVKQLSQGLILHYPLNKQGFGQENFILESHQVTGGAQASGITRTYEDDGTVKFVTASGNGNYATVYFARDSKANVGEKMSVGDIYTISCDVKVESGNKLPTLFINNGNGYKRLQGTIVLGKWIRAYYTSTWAEPGTTYGNITLHLGFLDAIGTYYFKNFKLEKSDVPTPWTPAPTDELYTTLGLDSNIEYDTSGYCNNGTRTGTFTWTSDTPKYAVSTKLESESKVTMPFTYNIGTNPISIGCWHKINTTGTYNPIFNLGTAKSGLTLRGNHLEGGNGSSNFDYAISALQNNATWHHTMFTYDGTNIKVYQNGELIYTQAAPTVGLGSVSQLQLGKFWATCNSVKTLSDFRIYATALSADDVLSLYQNCATIDPDGTIRGQIRS